MDAIDQLIARSKPHRELQIFHDFHRANPHVLDFLVQEIQLRLGSGFEAFSFGSLWDYARWKLDEPHRTATYKMNDHLAAFYGRAILILHPEFNGRAECRKTHADEIFGLRLEPLARRRKGYARRLEWKDGTSLESGWRPSMPHIVRHHAATKTDIHTR